jgi:hypothetical protein
MTEHRISARRRALQELSIGEAVICLDPIDPWTGAVYSMTYDTFGRVEIISFNMDDGLTSLDISFDDAQARYIRSRLW